MSLHGTLGWPHIPGSTLKGAAAAWARRQQKPAERRAAVFGGVAATPGRPDDKPDPVPATGEVEGDELDAEAPADPGDDSDPDAAGTTPGTVRFLDALPKPNAAPKDRLQVHSDVITPHHSAYHTQEQPQAPGEHEQPRPLPFLSLSGVFVADLVGDDPDTTETAAAWLAEACDDHGIGARTSAGYGYLTATDNVDWTIR
ncbi:type III-B CRISPR module RAMP protein Cmr6 [Salinactinospora qingdaonensis]|uniref:type III-B CRISPR module RAMP protein Cmr6 n=1 Tax=Salinactinospora qingdaonensis TaxID=702744 RepID=UPI0031EBCCD5